MEIAPLDDLLSEELLVFSRTDEEFKEALHDKSDQLKYLYEDELKFMLFQGDAGNRYLRLERPPDNQHYVIMLNLSKEVKACGIDPATMAPCGGGFVKARRNDGVTELFFYGASDRYGEFDRRLLVDILENNLDRSGVRPCFGTLS